MATMKSGPYTRVVLFTPAIFEAHTIGMPSGHTMPAWLWIHSSSASVWHSMTPCTPVKVTKWGSRSAIHCSARSRASSMVVADTGTPSTSTR